MVGLTTNTKEGLQYTLKSEQGGMAKAALDHARSLQAAKLVLKSSNVQSLQTSGGKKLRMMKKGVSPEKLPALG